jgi:hypothetical protein
MDTTATFTPGPWEFADGYITANGEPLSMVGVSIPMTVGPTRLEAIHNSRLAAAAPDMLAALKGAEIAVTQLCIDQHPDNECWNILHSISNAIAKATGEQS